VIEIIAPIISGGGGGSGCERSSQAIASRSRTLEPVLHMSLGEKNSKTGIFQRQSR